MKPRIYRDRQHGWWVTEVRGRPVGYSSCWEHALARLIHQHDVDTWWAAQDPLAPRPAGTEAPLPAMRPLRTWQPAPVRERRGWGWFETRRQPG